MLNQVGFVHRGSGICPPAPDKELEVRQVEGDPENVPPNHSVMVHATCAEDEVLTGGGWSTQDDVGSGFHLNLVVLFSGPNPDDPTHDWQILVHNDEGGVSPDARAIAQCAKLVEAP